MQELRRFKLFLLNFLGISRRGLTEEIIDSSLKIKAEEEREMAEKEDNEYPEDNSTYVKRLLEINRALTNNRGVVK